MKSLTMKLLNKEIKLGNNIQTIIWLICCFGMYFIPNYPSYIGPFYITISIMLTFALNQSSHDILYTVLLPVKKIDVVKARFLYCGMLELFALLSAVIAALVKTSLHFPVNKAGISLNVAYFGLQMIVLAVFNLIFLGNVYKNPLKPGLRFFIAAVAYFIVYALCELPIWLYIAESPVKLASIGKMLSDTTGEFLGQHCKILLGGFLIYTGVWYLTFRFASRQFEKYDM